MDNSQSTGVGLGVPPMTPGADPVVPPTPVAGGDGLADGLVRPTETKAGLEEQNVSAASVEPVPLPKATGVATPSTSDAGIGGQAAPQVVTMQKPEEPHPLFEKPVTVAPGIKEEGKRKKEEGHGLSKTVVAGIAGLVFLVVGGLVGGSYLVKQEQDVKTLAEASSCDQARNEWEGCAGSSGCSQSEPGWGCATGLYCFYAGSGDVCRQVGHIIQGSGNSKVLTLGADQVSNLSCGQ